MDRTKVAPSASVDIALHQLDVGYRGRLAVEGLSGEFATGSLTAVVGPNGAGKSTLLAAMAGVLQPVRGKIDIEISVRARMAWLPQQLSIDRSFPVKTFDFVAMGLWAQVGSFKALNADQRDLVHQALVAVRLNANAERNIGELSAGQFQRALFARVWLQNASVILLDEPFNAVDARTTADLLDVVALWHAEGRTVIAVLHDIEQVTRHFERTLLMARRCVAWGPSVETLCSANLLQAERMSQDMSTDWEEREHENKNSNAHASAAAHASTALSRMKSALVFRRAT